VKGVAPEARLAQLGRAVAGFVLLQAAWFACVVGAARDRPAIGIAAVALVVTLLLAWSRRRRADMVLVVIALAVGAVWDSALLRTGLVDYASPGPLTGWAPAWILALWALMAPMLREPLRGLHGRTLPAALLGAAGGALSYAAAERLGACRLAEPALAVIALGWAALLPLLIAAARRLDRGAARDPAAARWLGVRP
jgi:hypothetical protein